MAREFHVSVQEPVNDRARTEIPPILHAMLAELEGRDVEIDDVLLDRVAQALLEAWNRGVKAASVEICAQLIEQGLPTEFRFSEDAGLSETEDDPA